MQIDRPIAIALILFIIVLLIFFLVMPEYKKFQSLQTELGEKKAEFNAEFDYYNAIANTYSKLQNYQQELKTIDNALPAESNLGNLVYFLQKQASESGIIIKSLFLSKSSSSPSFSSSPPISPSTSHSVALQNTMGQNTTEQNVKELGITVSLLGSYNSLGGFIRSLEKSSRLFEVPSISFSSGSQESNSSGTPGLKSQFQTQQMFSFNLQLKTHSY
jgi:Tfp pilus assembly protein PilO